MKIKAVRNGKCVTTTTTMNPSTHSVPKERKKGLRFGRFGFFAKAIGQVTKSARESLSLHSEIIQFGMRFVITFLAGYLKYVRYFYYKMVALYMK